MSFQTAHRWMKRLVFGAIPLLLFASIMAESWVGLLFFYLAIASAVGGLLIGLLFYRCPQCSRLLIDGRPKAPEKCPHCGHLLL